MKKGGWSGALQELFRKYGGRKHPLDHRSPYELLVMVVLSSQTTDERVNTIARGLFAAYPSMKDLAHAAPEDLFPHVRTVRSFVKKSRWLIGIGKLLRNEENIPRTMDGLTGLPGIGRKSANVIMSELGVPMEGVIVDLHVLRVAPRLGIARGTSPEQIERHLMMKIPQMEWRPLGMSLTYLGREICRPEPLCPECVVGAVCAYYRGRSGGSMPGKSGTVITPTG